MRRIIAALASGLDRLLSDPGARPPTLKTGGIVFVERSRAVDRYEALRATLEAGLAPERFVANGPGVVVPADRERRVNAYVVERWDPVPVVFDDDTPLADVLAATANAQVPIAGFRVTQHVRMRRSFAQMSPDEIRAHVLSLQQAPEDDVTYNGYYPTIKGNDVAHHDPTKSGMAASRGGQVLKGNPTYDANGRMTHDGTIRGGTEIRGGRAEYKRATKGYEQFGKGWFRDVDKIKADQQAKRDKKHEIEVAKKDALLPRKIGEL